MNCCKYGNSARANKNAIKKVLSEWRGLEYIGCCVDILNNIGMEDCDCNGPKIIDDRGVEFTLNRFLKEVYNVDLVSLIDEKMRSLLKGISRIGILDIGNGRLATRYEKIQSYNEKVNFLFLNSEMKIPSNYLNNEKFKQLNTLIKDCFKVDNEGNIAIGKETLTGIKNAIESFSEYGDIELLNFAVKYVNGELGDERNFKIRGDIGKSFTISEFIWQINNSFDIADLLRKKSEKLQLQQEEMRRRKEREGEREGDNGRRQHGAKITEVEKSECLTILGLNPKNKYNKKQITEAYHARALEVHPDRNDRDKEEFYRAKFQEINNAKERLLKFILQDNAVSQSDTVNIRGFEFKRDEASRGGFVIDNKIKNLLSKGCVEEGMNIKYISWVCRTLFDFYDREDGKGITHRSIGFIKSTIEQIDDMKVFKELIGIIYGVGSYEKYRITDAKGKSFSLMDLSEMFYGNKNELCELFDNTYIRIKEADEKKSIIDGKISALFSELIRKNVFKTEYFKGKEFKLLNAFRSSNTKEKNLETAKVILNEFKTEDDLSLLRNMIGYVDSKNSPDFKIEYENEDYTIQGFLLKQYGVDISALINKRADEILNMYTVEVKDGSNIRFKGDGFTELSNVVEGRINGLLLKKYGENSKEFKLVSALKFSKSSKNNEEAFKKALSEFKESDINSLKSLLNFAAADEGKIIDDVGNNFTLNYFIEKSCGVDINSLIGQKINELQQQINTQQQCRAAVSGNGLSQSNREYTTNNLPPIGQTTARVTPATSQPSSSAAATPQSPMSAPVGNGPSQLSHMVSSQTIVKPKVPETNNSIFLIKQ
ncbi:MAG: J domain-containing protein [Rickettsiales bacterium]|jgi:hypothetical protein|nr:J domain-containing protein [Rickettsiales bacterium]